MAILRNNIVSSDRFTYHAPTKIFMCDASDLGDFQLMPVYDDASDTGFTMRSEKTGKLVNYFLQTTAQDGEGEIQYWRFMPIGEDMRNNPAVAGTKVLIYND